MRWINSLNLLVLICCSLIPPTGQCAETQVTKAASSKKAPSTPRYHLKSPETKISTTAKKPAKKPSSPAKTVKKKTTTYRTISPKKKTSKTKYSYTSKSRYTEVSLPSPRHPISSDFVIEVNSPVDPRLERAYVQKSSASDVYLPKLPNFSTSYRGNTAAITEQKEFVQYSVDPVLQEYARVLLSKVPATHVAVVAMEPTTGRVLAIAGKSPTLASAAVHAGYPAASLFKVVTAAAALEHAQMHPDTEVAFRGGTYELSPLNYDPRPGADKRIMSVSEALGRSCNPVFSRVALKYLNPSLLRYEAAAFGFNSELRFQAPIPQSSASIPNDDYEFGRTAAGFGDVFISPVHAAALMSAIANEGRFPRPIFVDQIIGQTGETIYKSTPSVLRQSVAPNTARTLLNMMTATTTVGTSKREFEGQVPWEVPAKTGTLKGDNPKGLNNWFIGSAPMERPKIAVAVIVVNPIGKASKASHIGKLLLEKYLG